MKILILTNSDSEIQVSDDDYMAFCFCSWYLEKNGYIQEATCFFDINKNNKDFT
jgi:hypothetical protein